MRMFTGESSVSVRTAYIHSSLGQPWATLPGSSKIDLVTINHGFHPWLLMVRPFGGVTPAHASDLTALLPLAQGKRIAMEKRRPIDREVWVFETRMANSFAQTKTDLLPYSSTRKNIAPFNSFARFNSERRARRLGLLPSSWPSLSATH